MVSSAETTDYEADAFEDARDAQDAADISTPISTTRSLTDRRPSNGSLPTPKASTFSAADSPDPDEEPLQDSPASPPEDRTSKKPKQPKSPLLTTHRLSTSSLDDIVLTSSKDDEATSPPTSHSSPVADAPPPLPTRESKHGSRLQGLSATLPSVPWGPPPVNRNAPPPSQPPPSAPSRKLTSPFAWLSRGQNAQKENKTATSNRRNTGASVSTTLSNPDMLARFDGSDGDAGSTDSRKQLRNSLKDQFKLLRMREEGSGDDQVALADGQEEKGSGMLSTPPSVPDLDTTSPQPSPLPSPLPSTINPNLAPGTVAGISASATDAAAPVNWELWQQVVNQGLEAFSGTSAEELNLAIRRGIPQTIRGVIWQVLADSRNPDLEDVYRELCTRGTDKERVKHWGTPSPASLNGQTNGGPKEKGSSPSSRSSLHSDNSTQFPAPSISEKETEAMTKAQAELEETRKKKAKEDAAALVKLEKAIRRDLGSRTSYSKYFMSQRNQEALFNVCKAYALYDGGVGYAQGMNFIVMPLLFNMDDGEAFALLVKLMNKYGLRNMFIHDMPGLHRHLYQFERLLEDLEPALTCHLRRRGVSPQLYATQWFLTLFAYRFPLQLVLRIYDLIFEQGLESAILRFAVAIMRRNVDALLGMSDMTSLTSFLKEKLFDVYIDKQPSASSILESGFFGSSGASDKEIYRADIMVEDACAINLTPEMIQTYNSEWEEKTRAEKELAAEIEGYKHTIATQAARIRSLEEHAEKSDKEHVQIASELVRIKVENEELKDSNEGLKVEVAELKVVVDRQPAELEEKLRTEMDRIMKRNIEVQNENRAMEEQMAEMEKDLVEAKMKWAEISENHETLKQKWSDLRKALDG
ncbi:GTPase activating protein [Coccidioides immitis RS]|uniref:GTPase-activating protein GYP5 n=1 Tax=Coccidioides immitis (strain RS) TaxID=246410 RepID=A0A0E1S0C8_COCIM|nr:GTPase activating protein [Coccidioides immitis RS]EAS36111.1 GTPase activating protein [Coccidioides immitis RS]